MKTKMLLDIIEYLENNKTAFKPTMVFTLPQEDGIRFVYKGNLEMRLTFWKSVFLSRSGSSSGYKLMVHLEVVAFNHVIPIAIDEEDDVEHDIDNRLRKLRGEFSKIAQEAYDTRTEEITSFIMGQSYYYDDRSI